MPKVMLEIKVTLENIDKLIPQEPSIFRWHFKFSCTNCGEKTDKWQYFCFQDRLDLPGSRGCVNFMEKCKLCGRQNTLDAVKDSLSSYSNCKSSEWQKLVVFECRGLEPVDFKPESGWQVQSVGSGVVFQDVDLSDLEWADYDETAKTSIGLTEFSHRFSKTH